MISAPKLFAAAAGVGVAAPLITAALTSEHPKNGGHSRFENARTATYAEMGVGALGLTAAFFTPHKADMAAFGAGLALGGFVANRIAGGSVHVINSV
jgi:hypothetical protein